MGWAVGVVLAAFSADRAESAEDKRYQAEQARLVEFKKAETAKSNMAELEAQRARVQQLREARIRRASIEASAAGTGLGGGTSGIVGGASSVTSQAAGNIGTIGQQQTFAQAASEANIRGAEFGSLASEAGAKADMWRQNQATGMSIFSQYGGFTRLFGGSTHEYATQGSSTQ